MKRINPLDTGRTVLFLLCFHCPVSAEFTIERIADLKMSLELSTPTLMGELYFSAEGPSGREPYATDGRTFRLVGDLTSSELSSYPEGFQATPTRVFFFAETPEYELWSTGGGLPTPLESFTPSGTMYALGDQVLLGGEGADGVGTYTTDGNKVRFVSEVSVSSVIWPLNSLGVFRGGHLGRELFAIEEESIRRLDGIEVTGSFNELSGQLYFAGKGAAGTGLYRTNGTSVEHVSSVNPLGNPSSAFESYAQFDGNLFVSATGEVGRELYKITDGGVISIVSDLNPEGDSSPRFLDIVNETLLFSASDGTGLKLYAYDGTKVELIEAFNSDVVHLHRFGAVDAGLVIGASVASGGQLFLTDGVTISPIDDGVTVPSQPLLCFPGPCQDGTIYFRPVEFAGELVFGSYSPSGQRLFATDGKNIRLVSDDVEYPFFHTLHDRFISSTLLSVNNSIVFNGIKDGLAGTFRLGILGDYDMETGLGVGDLDLLSSAVLAGSEDMHFDINGDGVVGEEDRSHWIEELAATVAGDANLDGNVQFDDFLAIASGFGTDGGWSEGDFDGNGEIQFPDFLLLAENFGFERSTAMFVPEPASNLSVLLPLMCGFGVLRSRSHTTRAALGTPR